MRYKKVFAILFIALSSLQANQLKILANNFSGNDKKGISIFTGNVRITKGNDELNASKVTVYLDKKHQPTQMVADGHVSFFIQSDNNATYRGKAGRVVYFPKQKEYRFYKNVHLFQINTKREIDGDKIFMDITNGKAVAHGASKEPVTMIFHLQNKDKNSSK
jgi:lipopolysaccharide export system protein LptA